MTVAAESAARLALAASAGMAGGITHEVIHYALARAVGAENVGMEWVAGDRWYLGKPVVRYSNPPTWAAFWLVQLGPQLVGLGTAIGYLLTAGVPDVSFGALYAGMFLFGLTAFGGREDFMPSRAITE